MPSKQIEEFQLNFQKDMTYDNKKAGFHPLSRKNIFGKTTIMGVNFTSPSLLRVTECFYLLALINQFE